MPTCWAMVPKTSLLLRGFAAAPTFTSFVRSSFETGRADALFAPLVAMLAPPLAARAPTHSRQRPVGPVSALDQLLWERCRKDHVIRVNVMNPPIEVGPAFLPMDESRDRLFHRGV